MNSRLKKYISCVVASAICVTGGIGSLNANAYTASNSWSLFVVESNPNIPGQTRNYTCSLPAYSGGYEINCTNFLGSNNSYIKIASNFGFSCNITSIGIYNVNGYSIEGTARFTFIPYTIDTLSARGSISYNM